MDKLKRGESNLANDNIDEVDLLNTISHLIEKNQKEIFIKVNSSLILLFWHIGKEIKEFLLNNQRAEYGKKIVVTVSRQLVLTYGKNFEEKNLRRRLQVLRIPQQKQMQMNSLNCYQPIQNLKQFRRYK